MKKLLLVVFLFWLTGCTSQSIDINQRIAESMNDAVSFTVDETFEFKQYGKRSDQPDSLIIDTSNKLIVRNETLYSDSHTVLEQNELNIEQRELYEYESTINILNNTAYIKPDDTWYQVDLINLYLWNMGSIDPISVVNRVLYDSDNQYYKSESGVTGNQEDYRYVVVDLSQDTFEDLFATTIFYHIDVRYDYKVRAELEFDETYRVKSISFYLDDLLSQYRDYRVYELKSDISSLSATYHLEFSGYNESVIPTITNPVNWVYSDETREWIGPNETYASNMLYNIASDLKAVGDGTYQLSVEMDPISSYRYMYYELYFYSNDELIDQYNSQYYSVTSYEEILLYYLNTKTLPDEIKVVLRMIPEGKSTIVDATILVDVTSDSEFTDNNINTSEFVDKVTVLKPVAILSNNISGTNNFVTQFDLQMFAYQVVQNLDIDLYFYQDGLLVETLRLEDNAVVQNQAESWTLIIPKDVDQVYLNMNYNTSSQIRQNEKMTLDLKKVSEPFDVTGYHESVTITANEVLNDAFQDYQYQIKSSDTTAGMLFFVDDLGTLIATEYVQLYKDEWIESKLIDRIEKIYFYELFDKTEEKWIVPINS